MNIEIIVKDLLDGVRYDGTSVIECCLKWGITDSEYKAMLESSEELQRAHEIGEMHCAAWWHNNARELAAKGNASVLNFALKNTIGWQDKPEIKAEEKPEPLRAVEISILPPRKDDDDSAD